MTDDRSFARVELDVNAGRQRAPSRPAEDTPFRIALLGDFGGRGSRGIVERGPALVNRAAIRVDRDDFDDVLARVAPELSLTGADGVRVSVRFSELDDFHPDRLYERLPLFQSLRDLRSRLANPSTFAEAARELRGEPLSSPAEPARPRGGSVLEDILGGPVEGIAPAAPDVEAVGELQAVIRRIVAPHLVPDADPRQGAMVAQLDAAIAARMRAVLHHPAFQALEALWRALFLLVRRVDTNALLQLHIIDVSKGEIAADLAGDAPVESTALYRLLVERSVGTPGGEPWALLAGAYEFGAGEGDVALLGRLASIARAAGAPFVAGAGAPLAGSPSFHASPDVDAWSREESAPWERLRESADAPWVGLVAPRFLVRAPYGAADEAIDSFPFEEVDAHPAHDDLLWASPAFTCALLLAQAFSAAGWELRPGMERDIGGLPYHLVRDGAGAAPVPCAEILLTERAATFMMERGLMPLASLKDADAVRLVRFQSIARPLAALAGRWSGGATR